MFPSKFPLLPALQALLIAAVIIVGLCLTGNPLFLFGLYFMPQVPIMAGDEEGTELSDYSGNQIGFHAGESETEE